jgi:hypothetical protein
VLPILVLDDWGLHLRSTILQLRLDNIGAVAEQTNPLSNQVGLFETDRKSLDVGNESGWCPILWRYRENQSADRVLATQPYGVTSSPPRVDLAEALQRGRAPGQCPAGRTFSGSPAVLDDGPTRQMLADLEANYERVATSSRAHSSCGWAQVSPILQLILGSRSTPQRAIRLGGR